MFKVQILCALNKIKLKKNKEDNNFVFNYEFYDARNYHIYIIIIIYDILKLVHFILLF